MFINPGEFKRVITFKRNIGQDDWQTETTQNEVCQCWAKITSIGGKQFWEAQSIGSAVTHEVYIRYREDIDASMTITYKNREFDIIYMVDMEEQNQYIKLLVKERLF